MSCPIDSLHSWDVTPAQARAIQERLRHEIELTDRLPAVTSVAGVDIGIDRQRALTRAAVCRLAYPSLEPLEERVTSLPTRFPYVPGLLSFREIPAALEALAALQQPPQLILCDGHGYAHPRRFGLACHLGLLTGIATIGVAKSRLIGEYREPDVRRGSRTALRHDGEVIGMVLRTRDRVKPVFVSSGHRVSLATACDYVLACAPRYRLPETTRRADRLASTRRV